MNPFGLGVLGSAFQLGWLLVILIALTFLVRLYLRTRLSGFIWLLMAVVVWPMLSRFSTFLMPFLLTAFQSTVTSAAELSIILFGFESIVGAALLLVAAVVLNRQLAGNPPGTPVTMAGLPPYRP